MNNIAIFSSHAFERPYLNAANLDRFNLIFISESLSKQTVQLCKGCAGIAVFTSDADTADILEILKQLGILFIVTRSTGYDHIDVDKATQLQIAVANVPSYSPNAIAEHAVALMLALNRHLILSHEKVNRFDFRIDELQGFNIQMATVGVVGTGSIGSAFCKIVHGFGCKILAYDIVEQDALKQYGVTYVPFKTLCSECDVISLHAPLNEKTSHMIDRTSISWMKRGVMLINTARGKLVNTADVLQALDDGSIGYFGADVYEKEKGIFFYDLSENPPEDLLLKSLINHKNVLLTSHHAFLTKEALQNIARITFENIDLFLKNEMNVNKLN
jgi:D-lactate dehydrogenase